MGILQTILQILQILVTVVVMILVLLQSDNESGNIVSGGNSSTMGMSRDGKLAKYTKIVGVAFIILTVATSTVMLINVQ
ncbi:MAG: preprotein translocase subunit SecG [Clostridia bacterium]|nr:preprotein translocase subunit SecG [Clostridia bacterium]